MVRSSRLHPVTRTGSALLLVLLGMVALGAPAQATTGLEVGIRATTAPQAPSGTPFGYEVRVACSRADTPCEGVVARLPLGDAASYDVVPGEAGAPAGVQVTTAVEGEALVATVAGPLPAGTSVTVPFTVTPPNDVLADGTGWSLTPTATSTNAAVRGAPGGYTPTTRSSVEARTSLVARAVTAGNVWRKPGDEVRFEVEVACLQPEAGNVFPGRLEVAAELAPGLELVRTEPGATRRDDRTVTWVADAAHLPPSCTERGATTPVRGAVVARIAADQVDGTQLPLVLRARPSTGGSTPVVTGQVVRTTTQVTVRTRPEASPGGLFAGAFGQVRTSTADAGSTEDRSQATYAGDWLGTLPAQPGSTLAQYQPNEATGLAQAGFKASYNNVEGGSGYQVALSEQLPCLTGGTRHEPREGACAPAFHATTAAVWVDNDADGDHGPALPATYRAQALLTDGSRVALHRTGASPGLADGGQWAAFAIPRSAVGHVRAVEFPRTRGAESFRMHWAVYGYADAEVAAGDVLVARTSGRAHHGDWSTALTPRDAQLAVAGRPQLGVATSFADDVVEEVGGTTTLALTGRALLPGAPGGDLVLADRLPVGTRWDGAVPATVPVTVDVTHRGADGGQVQRTASLDLPLRVAANVGGSGRTLVTLTLPAAELAPWTSAGGARLDLAARLPVATTRPGLHVNEARLLLPGGTVADLCAQTPGARAGVVAPHVSGLDVPAAGCGATAPLRVEVGDGAASFSVDTVVRGDRDTGDKAAPALGLVSAQRGEATYTIRWRNTADVPLKDVVLYDVLPTPGDELLAGAAVGTPRGSGFGTRFVRIEDAPPGLQVQYATGTDVCHSDLGSPMADGCATWRETAPARQVRGLRVTSRETYAIGEGFDLTFTVAVPEGLEPGAVAWNTVAATARNAWTGSGLPARESQKVGTTRYADHLPPVVELSADRAYAGAGEAVTYRLSVSNPGPSPLTTNAPVGRLPVGLQFLSATLGGVVQLLLDAVGQLADGLQTGLLGAGERPFLPTLDADEPADEPAEPGTPEEPVDPGTPDEPAPAPASGGEVTWPALELAPYETKVVELVAAPDAYAAGTLLSRFELDGAILPDPCPEGAGVCAEVNVPSGTLAITHEADGDGVDLFGSGPTAIQVDCVRGGVAVHGFPRTVQLADGEGTADLPVPFGSVCTAGVTQDQGATAVAVQPAAGTRVTPETPAGSLLVATRFDLARLLVVKRVAGVGAPMAPPASRVEVSCTWRGATLPGFPVEMDLRHGRAGEVTAPLPVGALCSGADTDAAGADRGAAGAVTLRTATRDGHTVLELVSGFSAGRLVVRGDAALADDATVDVTCRRGSAPVWSGHVAVAPGRSVVAGRAGAPALLPAGTACTAAGGTAYRVSADGPATAVSVVAGDPSRLQELVITVGPRTAYADPVTRAGLGPRSSTPALPPTPGLAGLPGGLAAGLPGGVPATTVPLGVPPLLQAAPDSRVVPGAEDPEGSLGLASPAAAEAGPEEDGRRVDPLLPLAVAGVLLLGAGALWSRLRA
ncbi:hypothetical protein ACOACO_02225 [Nocardioides sp. CPCC 205120]|uniref:hypothetical protein n=1 Tax=Nocardioides sp. CPCC 205120 TaxID=3406462 RepID=UPI003B51109C